MCSKNNFSLDLWKVRMQEIISVRLQGHTCSYLRKIQPPVSSWELLGNFHCSYFPVWEVNSFESIFTKQIGIFLKPATNLLVMCHFVQNEQ